MPDGKFNDFGYLFIVTYGRSGSTLLQNVLNSIPGYEIMGENNGALFGLYLSIDAVERARQTHGRKPRYAHEPWYGADKFDPDGYRTGLLDQFVGKVLQPSPGTRVTGFKEIRYLTPQVPKASFEGYMQFMLRAFPNARIIFNIRDTKDVLNSGWWPERDQEKIGKKLKAADRQFRAFAKESPHAYLVNYDRFLKNPGLYRELFDFLQEPFDAARVSKVLDTRLDHIQKRV